MLAAPKAFCAEVAKTFVDVFGSSSTPPDGCGEAAFVMANVLVDPNKARVAQLASTAGWQARGNRLDQIVSEYKEVRTVSLPPQQLSGLVRRMRIKEDLSCRDGVIPAESQVIKIGELQGGVTGENADVTFGTPWTPMQFMQKALCLKHPFSETKCPSATSRAIFRNLTKGPTQ